MELFLTTLKYFCFFFTLVAFLIPITSLLALKWVERQNKKHREEADKSYEDWEV